MQFLFQAIQKTQLFGVQLNPEWDHQKVFSEFHFALITLSKIPKPIVRIRTTKMT